MNSEDVNDDVLQPLQVSSSRLRTRCALPSTVCLVLAVLTISDCLRARHTLSHPTRPNTTARDAGSFRGGQKLLATHTHGAGSQVVKSCSMRLVIAVEDILLAAGPDEEEVCLFVCLSGWLAGWLAGCLARRRALSLSPCVCVCVCLFLCSLAPC
eukprot:1358728-Rhodomonas_salina.1